MWEEIIDKKNLLRLICYHSVALSPDIAVTVANAITDSNPRNQYEIRQMGKNPAGLKQN